MELLNNNTNAAKTSPETFTFTTEQFLGLMSAVGVAVFWITYKIRGVEKDVKYMKEDLEKNPYLRAFKQLEERHAHRVTEKFDKELNIWEDQKKDEAHSSSYPN